MKGNFEDYSLREKMKQNTKLLIKMYERSEKKGENAEIREAILNGNGYDWSKNGEPYLLEEDWCIILEDLKDPNHILNVLIILSDNTKE